MEILNSEELKEVSGAMNLQGLLQSNFEVLLSEIHYEAEEAK